MSFSFIKPAPRPVFNAFSKILMGLIIIALVVLSAINSFLYYKNYLLSKQNQELVYLEQNLNAQITALDNISANLNDQVETAMDIYASNLILKQSIHNLFDLVPDSIRLDEVFMDRTSLIIRGITPNKEIFNQLLGSPLRSIFTTSTTNFYHVKNGWYGFVNTNKIDNLEDYNE